MKFLLEFVACCGSPTSETQRPAEDTRLLVEPRRRASRKHAKARNGHEWRPSLSSISEDVLAAEKIKNARRPAEGAQRSLKRKVATASQRERPRSSNHDDFRRANITTVMPTFSPAPIIF